LKKQFKEVVSAGGIELEPFSVAFEPPGEIPSDQRGISLELEPFWAVCETGVPDALVLRALVEPPGEISAFRSPRVQRT
jgi:hypothetical protein